jgi:ethanolamine utilization protein EutJ
MGFSLPQPSAPAELEKFLAQAEQVILPANNGNAPPLPYAPDGPLYVGVDLGTAYTVLVVLDQNFQPIAGEYQFAQVVRDGLVVDFIGATDLLRAMKARVEKRIGRPLTSAASGYPPGVPQTEVRATAHVVEAAEMECTGLVDEPTAANNVLGIEDGAVVDVGGGTTGVAIIKDGKVVYTADEATGGTHFSLVIAGSLNISFEEAEQLKITPSEQTRLFPMIRPVMQKVGSIVSRQIRGYDVKKITLVGGTTAYPGMAGVIQEYTGITTEVPTRPLFVTPIGIAMHNAVPRE